MLKVLRITEDKVMLGNLKTKELKIVKFEDCYENIKVGDIVEVYTSDEIEIVTIIEEKDSNTQENFDEHQTLPEVNTEHVVSILKNEDINELDIHQHLSHDSVAESNYTNSTKPLVRIVLLIFVMVFAVALSFYVASFLNDNQPNKYLNSFQVAQDYLNQMSDNGFVLIEYDDLMFYEVPIYLKDAGRTIDLFMIGQFSVVMFDRDATIQNFIIICEFSSYDEIDYCQSRMKQGE